MIRYIKEYGFGGAVKHICDKCLWLFDRHKFKHAGKHIYLAYPNVITGHSFISIDDSTVIRCRLQMEAISTHNGQSFTPSISIGKRVSINNDVHIAAIDSIKIGDDVLIASKVYISDHSHGNTTVEDIEIPPSKRSLYSKGSVVIEDCVWIGEGVAIMPGVVVGKNSIIGANSVVTRDIPANCVAAGCPAKIIKRLEKSV